MSRAFDELLSWQIQAARSDRSSAPAVSVSEELAREGRFAEFALLLRAWIALKPHQRESLLDLAPGIVLVQHAGADEYFIQSHPDVVAAIREACLAPERLPAVAAEARARVEAFRARKP